MLLLQYSPSLLQTYYWLWTLTTVFQQLLIHCKITFWPCWLLIICTSFLSAAGDEFEFSSWNNCTMHEVAPSDFPDVLFQINSELFKLPQCSICGYQTAQKSHQLLLIIITQQKLRGHDTKTTFYNHLSWSFKLLSYACFFDAADLVTFSEDL